jgi:hypothetical protein
VRVVAPHSCTLCHQLEEEGNAEADEAAGLGHPSGRRNRGLGRLLLVRVSAITHAWVHDQCAHWSPETWYDHGRLQVRQCGERPSMWRALCLGRDDAWHTYAHLCCSPVHLRMKRAVRLAASARTPSILAGSQDVPEAMRLLGSAPAFAEAASAVGRSPL